jgi:hypothetical protein
MCARHATTSITWRLPHTGDGAFPATSIAIAQALHS